MNSPKLFFSIIFCLVFQSNSSNWYQNNGILYRDSSPVTLHGVNWFGLETPARAPSGLWTSHVKNGQTVGHSIAWFMSKIHDLGFNAVRIPLSPQSLSNDPNNFPPASWARQWDPSLTTGWKVLNSMLAEAQKNNLYVLIDFQTCNENQLSSNLPGLPTNCPGYTLGDWTQDLQSLAKLGISYPLLFGIDIFNEPHGCDWSTWKSYAEAGVAAVYHANSDLVAFVEGIDGNVPGDGTGTNWGENLYYVGGNPVTPTGIPTNKIVYSPHVYDVGDNDWQKCFGYLQGHGYTVIVGEFGYDSTSSYDVNTFAPNLINFLRSTNIGCFFYWCINANDSQLGYLAGSDGSWCTVTSEKINKFKVLGVNPQSYITSTNPPSICN